jgi:ribosomal-protein-serine acetyltransferase
MSIPRPLRAGPLRLEQLEERCAGAMWEAVEESRAALRPYLVWVEGVHSIVDVERFIARARLAANEDRECIFGVSSPRAPFLGAVGLYNLDQRHRSAELGFWTRASWAGRGICAAAAARVVRFAFEEAGLHRLFVRHAADNSPSRAVVLKLGFTREGVARDDSWIDGRWVTHETYSLLVSEYRGLAPALLALEDGARV